MAYDKFTHRKLSEIGRIKYFIDDFADLLTKIYTLSIISLLSLYYLSILETFSIEFDKLKIA